MSVVSIILPTYNRARFLPEAFASIRAQLLRDWELIIVDDGSTDNTAALVEDLTRTMRQPVKCIRQDNAGPAAARNAGLEHATGEYIAFFDSDDIWLPEHLQRCLLAFQRAPEIDWVFAACRCEDMSGAVLQPNTFEHEGSPRAFLLLRTRSIDDLQVIDDPDSVECQITSGLYCGFQNSLIRRRVFADHRLEDYRAGEDSLFVLRALLRGVRFAYLRDVHVIYRLHADNSSAAAVGSSWDKMLAVNLEIVRGLTKFAKEVPLNRRQTRVLAKRLADLYFWRIGYVCCLGNRDTARALRMFRQGLRLNPYSLKMWKTYFVCLARSAIGRSA